MNEAELKRRTKSFGLQIISLTESLPRDRAADVIARQLVRSAVSVGANYRAACRAKSRPDFLAKMAIVEEEADESHYWLEMLVEARLANRELLSDLAREADELTAIIVSSIRTARTKRA
ncbi:MAG: four helix bundle protein [Armatimonadetes bacterium]|nr:four helix bundle protein [Armatimonadota bacterium]